LYDIFIEQAIRADDVLTLTSDELEHMGVDSDNAQRFLLEVVEKKDGRKSKEKEETKRKESLKQLLTKMNCPDLLEIFYNNDITADNLMTLDKEKLMFFGVKVGIQKRFLREKQNIEKLQNTTLPSMFFTN